MSFIHAGVLLLEIAYEGMGSFFLHIDNRCGNSFHKEVLARCDTFMREGVFDGCMVIVPTQRWAHFIREQLLEHSDSGIAAAPFIFGYNQAIDIMYDRLVTHPSKEPDEPERLAISFTILKNILQEMPEHETLLQRFPPTALTTVLADTVDTLKTANLTPEKFLRVIAPGRGNDTSLNFGTRLLYSFFDTYQAYIENNNLMDFADKVNGVSNILEEDTTHFTAAFPRLEYLAFMGFDLFSQSLYRMITNLSSNVRETHLLLEYDETRRWVFEHLNEPLERLSEFADEVIVEQDRIKRDTLHTISEAFFREPENHLTITSITDSRCGLIKGKDPEDEIDQICRWLKHTVLHNPLLSLEKIGVCFPRIEEYLALIHHLFPRYGIPYSISLPEPLSESMYCTTILSLVHLAETNFERRAVLHFLDAPYSRVLLEPTDDDILNINTALLSEIATTERVIDGRDSWSRALENTARFLALCMEEENEDMAAYEESRYLSAEKAGVKLKEVNAIKHRLEQLFSIVSRLQENTNLAEFSTTLKDIIATLHLEQKVRVYREQETMNHDADVQVADTAVREMQAVVAVREMITILEESSTNEIASTMTLNEFSQLFEQAAGATTVPGTQPRRGRIQILGKLEPRGVTFDYLIFAGLTDGAFPRPLKSDPLLSEEQRNDLHLVPRGEYVLSKDLFIFYRYMQQVEKAFICSYPMSSNDRILLPSIVIEELQRIAEVDEIIPPPESELYSREGVHEYIGESIRTTLQSCAPDDVPERIDSLDCALCEQHMKEHIMETVRMNYYRQFLPYFTEFEGILGDNTIKAELCSYTDKVFSVSQLEQYGGCPFEYFSSRLLGIEKLPEIEEEISPLVRGTLVHAILYRFYTRWFSEGNHPPASESDAQRALDLLRGIASEEISRFKQDGAFWQAEQDLLFGDPGQGLNGVLDEFIRLEMVRSGKEPAKRYRPGFFEVGFGMKKGLTGKDELSTHKPYILKYKGDTIKLRGRIDRLDVADNGYIVIDYKTSSSSPGNIDDLDKGFSLQLPVYAMAAGELLRNTFATLPECHGTLYYLVREPGECRMENFLSPEETLQVIRDLSGRPRIRKGFVENFDQYLETATSFIAEYLHGIRDGIFAVKEVDKWKRCDWCDYQRICRADFALIRALKNNPYEH